MLNIGKLYMNGISFFHATADVKKVNKRQTNCSSNQILHK